MTCDQFEDGAEVIIKKGNKYDFTITFEAGTNLFFLKAMDKNAYAFLCKAISYILFGFTGEDAPLMTPTIFGVIAGINVPWLGVPANACTSLVSGSCPLVKGQTYVYSASVDVLSSYPAVSISLLLI